MTDYVSSISIDEVIDALAAFIAPFVGSAEVIRAQVNRVPMPLGSVVLLTEMSQTDLSIPYSTYDFTDGLQIMNGPNRIDVQIDFYGPNAGEFCKAIKTAFRTDYAYQNFPDGIKPLYTNDGMQSPLVTGEEQYESRWTLLISLQYNPIITVPQQSANVVELNLFVQADEPT